MLNPGDLLKHKHSRNNYWYVGKHPRKALAIIYSDTARKSFVIGISELDAYYELTKEPHTFEEGKTYKSQSTGSLFTVESLFDHPTSGKKVAFGWYQAEHMSDKIAHNINERSFDHWQPVS